MRNLITHAHCSAKKEISVRRKKTDPAILEKFAFSEIKKTWATFFNRDELQHAAEEISQ